MNRKILRNPAQAFLPGARAGKSRGATSGFLTGDSYIQFLRFYKCEHRIKNNGVRKDLRNFTRNFKKKKPDYLTGSSEVTLTM